MRIVRPSGQRHPSLITASRQQTTQAARPDAAADTPPLIPICVAIADTLTPIAARAGDFIAWGNDDLCTVYDGTTAGVVHEWRVDPARVLQALDLGIIAPASPEHDRRMTTRRTFVPPRLQLDAGA